MRSPRMIMVAAASAVRASCSRPERIADPGLVIDHEPDRNLLLPGVVFCPEHSPTASGPVPEGAHDRFATV
jgi:hypothetical protein